jgi:GNAT superfamily N-acetyltransferase
VHLRDFGPHDQDAVRSLILDGLGEHWGIVDASLNPDLDDIAASYGAGRTVVLVDDEGGRDQIVATGTIVRRDATTAEIVRMSVTMTRRGAGLGRAVLDALVQTARTWNVQRIVLETTAAWGDVVAFYERCGFRITHHVDGAFGADAWFEMRLD